MKLQEVNLEDVLKQYSFEHKVRWCIVHLLSLSRSERKHLLRNHKQKTVSGRYEIKYRAKLDSFLDACGAIEVASIAEFIPAWLTGNSFEAALDVLNDEYVRKYYEEHYPCRLPQLLRLRLENKGLSVTNKNKEDMFVEVIEFLELDAAFNRELNDGYFLRILDGFTIGDYSLEDFIDSLDRSSAFIALLLENKESQDVKALVAREFCSFLEFAESLYGLLLRMGKNPLLQASIWSHYSYWFEVRGQRVCRKMKEAVKQFEKWEVEIPQEMKGDPIREYIVRMSTALDGLTTGMNAAVLDEFLQRSRD